MGSKTVFYQFDSPHTKEEVQDAAMRAFLPLGGQIIKMNNGLSIKDGKEGVQFGFTADFEANLMINQPKQDHYELVCTINWKMNTLTIACLIIGIFVFGILWIIPVLFLFIDPSSLYQQTLVNIPFLLDKS
jgi:hypothetical protein